MSDKSPKTTKRKIIFSDSDSDSDYVPDEDIDEDIDEEIDDHDITNDKEEYKKFLNSIFPSSYMKKQIKDEKMKKKVLKKMKNTPKSSNKSSKKNKVSKSDKGGKSGKVSKSCKASKAMDTSNNRTSHDTSENKTSNDASDNIVRKRSRRTVRKTAYSFPTEEEEDDEEELSAMSSSKFSIVYTFGEEEHTDNSDECDTESDSGNIKYTLDENAEEWEVEMKKSEDEVEDKENIRAKMISVLTIGDVVKVKNKAWSKKYIGSVTRVYKNNKFFDIKLNNPEFEPMIRVSEKYILEKVVDLGKMQPDLKTLILMKKNNPDKFDKKMEGYIKELSDESDKELSKRDKLIKKRNTSRLKKLLREKNATNDFSYFKNMKISEQKNILKNMVEMNKISTIDKPYKISLIESNIKPEIKAVAMKKINLLSVMDPCTGDYYKNKLWVDTFMSIPFGKYANLPVKLDDGIEQSKLFMKNAKKTLDEAVYGLNDAKMQIMQMLGGWISNPEAVGTSIAIQGPMGTGKTSLIKDGISKILNRPFAFIPLGGATDSSYLEGHSYTYEGSIWGKIVETLISSKCMNPVFYFDELDKVSNTPKGEEIIGILTHLTDTTQNSQFHDKYFSNLDFDLSKALFIFSYNYEEKVNPILKDRMYQIKTKGYDTKDKNIIARDYLISKIEKNINFKKGEVTFADGVFEYIIDKHTSKEKGVRNFKRCLEIIYSKLNLFRLMEKDTTLFEKEEIIDVEFPFEVTKEIVDKLIKSQDKESIPFGMYM